MKAAIELEPQSSPVLIDDLECAAPEAGQIRVQISHCGICHSDLTFMESPEAPLPMVLGHEAAGTVTAAGSGADGFQEGDSVMLSPFAPCDRCYYCVRNERVLCVEAAAMFTGVFSDGTSPLSRAGELVYRGLGVGGFSAETVVMASAAVKIEEDVPRSVAAVMGCAVQTGVGAVLNTAKMEPGATALVMGLGGIGISAVQGTRLAGASRVIATDPIASRRDMALKMGATDVLDPGDANVVVEDHVMDLTGGIGADYVFDCAGSVDLIMTGLRASRKGGTVVMVGVPSYDSVLSIPAPATLLVDEKKLIGSLYGSSDSRREVPRLLDFWRAGRLDLEGMVSSHLPIEEIQSGLDDMSQGKGLRTILEF